MTAPETLAPTPAADAPTSEALREFLGLLGYASTAAFTMLAQDAAHAPDIRTRLVMSRMAAGELAEIDHVERLVVEHGGDFDTMMESYRDLFNDFLVRAVPRDWWERLVRSYVGYNMVQDMLRALAEGVPAQLRAETAASVGSSGHDDLVAAMLVPVLRGRAPTGRPARPVGPARRGRGPHDCATVVPGAPGAGGTGGPGRRASAPGSSVTCRPNTRVASGGSD